MIEPNFNMFLWILLAYLILESVLKIIAGLLELEKGDHYSIGDAIMGVIWLILLFAVIWC